VAVPIAGHGWSSPIVWGDTVFMTSAISSRRSRSRRPVSTATTTSRTWRRRDCPTRRSRSGAQARDNELTAEADEIRYMVYALDARPGK
jgi:hypothetical protein